MPDDQQLSGSDGGSGGSVSDAERMGEESEVGHKMVSLLILSIWIYIFSGDFSILFYFVFFQKKHNFHFAQSRCCQRHIENGLFVHIIQQEKQIK